MKNVNITGGTLYFGDKANQTFQNTVFNLKGAVVDGVTGGRMDIWTKAVVNESREQSLGNQEHQRAVAGRQSDGVHGGTRQVCV